MKKRMQGLKIEGIWPPGVSPYQSKRASALYDTILNRGKIPQ